MIPVFNTPGKLSTLTDSWTGGWLPPRVLKCPDSQRHHSQLCSRITREELPKTMANSHREPRRPKKKKKKKIFPPGNAKRVARLAGLISGAESDELRRCGEPRDSKGIARRSGPASDLLRARYYSGRRIPITIRTREFSTAISIFTIMLSRHGCLATCCL